MFVELNTSYYFMLRSEFCLDLYSKKPFRFSSTFVFVHASRSGFGFIGFF